MIFNYAANSCILRSDIDSNGDEVEEERPSGADAEHRQAAKTINADWQKKKREEKRLKKLSEEHRTMEREYNIINDILARNTEVETELKAKTESGSLTDASVVDFLSLTAKKLQDFIHCRKFDDATFHQSRLVGSDGKLNKTRYKSQTAESIEKDCSDKEPCLVWMAWNIRSHVLVLEPRSIPVMNIRVSMPEFTVVYAGRESRRMASDYLRSGTWVTALGAVVKGVHAVPITDSILAKADNLVLALEPRLDYHIAERVHRTRHNHWTLRFTRDNLAPMAAAMCVVGHIVDDLDTYSIDERLLVLPMKEMFQIISRDLRSLEGCYLYFDKEKNKWIRSGKTAGDGKDACFDGRGNKHKDNATSKDEMRNHPLYAKYPARGCDNIGAREGYFDNLDMYCGMAFDTKEDVKSLCSYGADDSLFVWSKESMNELKKKGGKLQTLQLDAIAYLWEICYDLLLAKGENVSVSPGFESLGLRVNNKKRSTSGESTHNKRRKL